MFQTSTSGRRQDSLTLSSSSTVMEAQDDRREACHGSVTLPHVQVPVPPSYSHAIRAMERPVQREETRTNKEHFMYNDLPQGYGSYVDRDPGVVNVVNVVNVACNSSESEGVRVSTSL